MITGTISIDDYLNAQRLHRRTARRRYGTAGVIATIAGAISMLFGHPLAGMILIGAGVGSLVGELITSRIYLPWKIRRIHRQQKDFAAPLTYAWTADSLEAKGASGYARRPWKNYVRCKEDEQLFLLYHADNLFEMLPKRWFRDHGQIAEFRAHAASIGRA